MPTLTANYSFNKPLVNNATDADLWGGYLNDSLDLIDTQIKTVADSVGAIQTVPSGMIFAYGGTTEPAGYLFCYGQAVSRATYSALFTAISTTYGVGDGSTTFNLPDLRGRVVAGQDDMGGTSANRLTGVTGSLDGDTLGATGGAETVTLSISQMPSHGHPYRTTTSPDGVGSGGLMSSTGGQVNQTAFNGTPSSSQSEQIGGSGGGQAHANVQPTIVLNYVIKT